MHGSAEFLDLKRFRLGSKVTDADFVVCISDYCRSQLMWLVEPDQWPKLSVIHCGVVADGRPEILDRGALTTLRVLTVGRLIRLKAHALLLEASEVLRERGITLQIRIVGGGPYEKQLRTIAAARGLQNDLELVGPVGEEELVRHYQWCDVFCLPSVMEGLPVVLMEAMSMGRPVVATAITGVPELVEDELSGLLVRPGRADLLAEALERLAREPELRTQLSERGYERVRSHFDLSTTAAQLESLFAASGSIGGTTDSLAVRSTTGVNSR